MVKKILAIVISFVLLLFAYNVITGINKTQKLKLDQTKYQPHLFVNVDLEKNDTITINFNSGVSLKDSKNNQKYLTNLYNYINKGTKLMHPKKVKDELLKSGSAYLEYKKNTLKQMSSKDVKGFDGKTVVESVIYISKSYK